MLHLCKLVHFNPHLTVNCFHLQDVIAHLRKESHAQVYSSAMSPPVCRQIIAATQAIMGLDGTNNGETRIRQLAENTRYNRTRLTRPRITETPVYLVSLPSPLPMVLHQA